MAATSVTGLAKLETVAALTMAMVFGVVAGILGLVLWFSGYSGGSGLILALLLSLVLMLVQWWFSPSLIRLIMRLKEVNPGEQSEWLRSTVEKLTREAGIPMPKLYVADNPTPNAFAFGRGQGSAGIAVHTGLLKMLDKEEVEAVLAHEVGHIKHRDMIVMTIASVLPVLLYYVAIALGSRDRSGGDDRGRGNSTILVFFGAMFARLLGTVLVMWLSRTREFYADEFSAHVTKRPQNLMAALSKISYGLKAMPHEGGAIRAFYIADPETASAVPQAMSLNEIEAAVERDKAKGFMEIFMTHPLTSKRLLNLKRLESEMGA